MNLFSRAPREETDVALSVTQLVRRMKNLVETGVGRQWIVGEVSNLRRQASGHWYFSLKDEGAQISCAMFGARRRAGAEVLEDGVKVRVLAEASVYEARGQLQIIVEKAERAGLGDLQARFEALKRKLEAEGLFAPERKKPLPRFPKTVGIVTSGTGAALRDILNVLGRRAPWVRPVLYPVPVQGKGAERGLARAIRELGNPEAHQLPRCDVLIVGRGGGSLEDLWNFNEEIVARAIAACPLPVISAVGHEIDFTIADFVADQRAPTPSAGAELAVPDAAELRQLTDSLGRRLRQRAGERMERLELVLAAAARGVLARDHERLLREPVMRVDMLKMRLANGLRRSWLVKGRRLDELGRSLAAQRPQRRLALREEALARLARQLAQSGTRAVAQRIEALERLAVMLRTLGPGSAFDRGFSITTTADGKLLRSVTEIPAGTVLHTRLADGRVTSRVEEA